MAELYNDGWTLESIGKKFGMTRQGVRSRFMTAGITRRHWLKYPHIDKEHLAKLYSDDKLPLSDIADIFSVSIYVIKLALEFHKIPRRKPLFLGGYAIDFLRRLKCGEAAKIELRTGNYTYLYPAAKRIGIKITIGAKDANKFMVTRIE